MIVEDINILIKHGKQFIPDVTKAEVPAPFRGRPVITSDSSSHDNALMRLCPFDAISSQPLRIDLGKCGFCGECELAFPSTIRFTNDHKIASNTTEKLLVKEGVDQEITLDENAIRNEIQTFFNGSLKLRQVSAGGDNSTEMELGACGNVNFDVGRFGIEFVASPRHADGIVVSGPISENMAEALRIAYEAVPSPKLFILAGVDAISGGIFKDSQALDRRILNEIGVDLYVPGNPPHPLTFINGILELTRKKYRRI